MCCHGKGAWPEDLGAERAISTTATKRHQQDVSQGQSPSTLAKEGMEGRFPNMEEAAVAKNSLAHMSIGGQWTHCRIYSPPSFLGAHIPTNTF